MNRQHAHRPPSRRRQLVDAALYLWTMAAALVLLALSAPRPV